MCVCVSALGLNSMATKANKRPAAVPAPARAPAPARRERSIPTMDALEYTTCRPCPKTVEDHKWRIECKECTAQLSKKSVPKHMADHGIDKSVSSKWHCVKDGQNWRTNQMFELSYNKYKEENLLDSDPENDDDEPEEGADGEEEEEDEEEGGEEEKEEETEEEEEVGKEEEEEEEELSNDESGKPGKATTFRNVFAAEGVKPKHIGVEAWVKEWVPPWDTPPKTVRMPPDVKGYIENTNQTKLDLTKFTQWVASQDGEHEGASSVDVKNAHRLVNCLVVPEGMDVVAFICAIHEHDVLQELYGTKFFNMRYNWPKAIIDSLYLLVKFAKSECSKPHHFKPTTRDILKCFEQDVLDYLYARRYKQEKTQRSQRKQADGEKMQGMPIASVIKAAIFCAMIDLQSLGRRSFEEGADYQSIISAATTIMIGIIWFNGFGGRSKEWQIMMKGDILRQLACHPHFVICPDHKTARTYGDLAKWIAAGTLAAITFYCNMPCHTGEYFLCAVNDVTKSIYVAYFLKKFCMIYFPGYPNMNVNLIRKHFHTALLRRQNREDLWNLLEKADAHSKTVAQTVYFCMTADDDVQFGEILYRSVWGHPVEWPQQLPLEDDVRTMQDINYRLALHDISTQQFNEIADEHWVTTNNDDNALIPIGFTNLDDVISTQLALTWQGEPLDDDEREQIKVLPLGDGNENDEELLPLDEVKYDPIPVEDAANTAANALPVVDEPTANTLSVGDARAAIPSPSAPVERFSAKNLTKEGMNKLFGQRQPMTLSLSPSPPKATSVYDKFKEYFMTAAHNNEFHTTVPDAPTLKKIFEDFKQTEQYTPAFTEPGLRSWYRRKMADGSFNPTVLASRSNNRIGDFNY